MTKFLISILVISSTLSTLNAVDKHAYAGGAKSLVSGQFAKDTKMTKKLNENELKKAKSLVGGQFAKYNY